MKHRIERRAPNVLLGAALLLLAACGAPRGTSSNAVRGQEGSSELEEIDGSRGLRNDLEIVGYRSERRDGRLHVQFDLRNKRGSNLAFEWTMDWYDSSGFRIDTQEHWRPVAIGGKGFETIAVTAPTPEASSFKLEYRLPNPVR